MTVETIAIALQKSITDLDPDENECLEDIVRDYEIPLPNGLEVFTFYGFNGEYAAVYDSDGIKAVYLDEGDRFSYDSEADYAVKKLDSELSYWWTYGDGRYWYLSLNCKNDSASQSDIDFARYETMADYKDMQVSFLGRCGGNLCICRYRLDNAEDDRLTTRVLRHLTYANDIKTIADTLTKIRLAVEEFKAKDFTNDHSTAVN